MDFLDRLTDEMVNIEFKTLESAIKDLRKHEDMLYRCHEQLVPQNATEETSCKCVYCLKVVSLASIKRRVMCTQAEFALALAMRAETRIENVTEHFLLLLGKRFYYVRLTPKEQEEWLDLKMHSARLRVNMTNFISIYST